jgi:hypothetical protein
MRRIILHSLFLLLALSAANVACAQHRGGVHGSGNARHGHGSGRGRAVSPYGFGYGYGAYDGGAGLGYDDGSQPAYFVQQPGQFVQPPAPAAVRPPGHPVVTEYTWPTASSSRAMASTTVGSETHEFGIVLKDGSTLPAVMVFASDDGLHYVDPDARHLHIAMSDVDRTATLKLNRARNLDLYLPAAQ